MDDGDLPEVMKLHPWPVKNKYRVRCGSCNAWIEQGERAFLMTDGLIWSTGCAAGRAVADGYRPQGQTSA